MQYERRYGFVIYKEKKIHVKLYFTIMRYNWSVYFEED